MNQQLTLPSPGKINLFLHVNGQLENGYHELQTLFQFIDLHDTLHFSLEKPSQQTSIPQHNLTKHDVTLRCDDESMLIEDNLIFKAARALQETAQEQTFQPVTITLEKILPAGGGIGGGSSNAATTLLALNELWQLNLTSEQLQSIGLTLGADVPVFIKGQSVFADGVGEKFSSAIPPEQPLLLLKPNCHINTATIFKHPELPRNTAKIAISDYQFETTKNDCEALVKKLNPEVATALSWLIKYAPSRLTGTGACIFGLFKHEESARHAHSQLPENLTGFITKGMNESPTIAALKRWKESN